MSRRSSCYPDSRTAGIAATKKDASHIIAAASVQSLVAVDTIEVSNIFVDVAVRGCESSQTVLGFVVRGTVSNVDSMLVSKIFQRVYIDQTTLRNQGDVSSACVLVISGGVEEMDYDASRAMGTGGYVPKNG